MQQSRISQYFFQSKKKDATPQDTSKSAKKEVVSSTTTPNVKASLPISESSSESKKRVREDIPLIELIDDEEDDSAKIPRVMSSKERVLEVLSREPAVSDFKRQKFRQVIFQNELPTELEEQFEELMEEHEVIPAPSKKQAFTPLETQVVNIRKQFPDCLLMVECGYRMRFFGQDALNASKILGIYAHQDHNFMVASVPTYRASFHCQRLLSAGQKVAVVRQTETAALRKGSTSKSSTFDRKVAGVFTQGIE